MKAARKLRQKQHPQSLVGYVRQFLTPVVWKQARHAAPRRRKAPRWDLQPLVFILLSSTWAGGDSQFEKFEAARGFYVMAYEGRKRPGKTLEGFQKALARLPMRQLRALAEGVRERIQASYADRLIVDGFVPVGCDGSRVECPRSAELESRMGQSGKDDSAPTLWITAFVHLGLGLLWSWRLGKGTADERAHLRELLPGLPSGALIVADAAYMGYELAQAILKQGHSFLLRLSSKTHLYTVNCVPIEQWEEGVVYYWPQEIQRKKGTPLECRLIRVKAKGSAKRDVWLLTSVLDPTQLSITTAARFYRWRWRNEGLFRTYKRTLNKLKLSSRTVRLVHREAEGSLLALQILLAHADLALRPRALQGAPAISPRKVLIAVRREITRPASLPKPHYARALQNCRPDLRRQESPKATREWPRRKPHKPPKAPILKTLTDPEKALLRLCIQPKSKTLRQ